VQGSQGEERWKQGKLSKTVVVLTFYLATGNNLTIGFTLELVVILKDWISVY